MGRRKCCVINCKSTSETHCLYKFPKNDNVRQLWMSYLVPQNSSLLMLSVDQLFNQHVCQLHFERRMFDDRGKKIRTAYPCLFTEKEISHGVPLTTDGHLLYEHNYCKSDEENNQDMDDISHDECFILRPGDNFEHSYTLTCQSLPTCSKNQEYPAPINQTPSLCSLPPSLPTTSDTFNITNITTGVTSEKNNLLVQDAPSSLTNIEQKKKVISPKKKVSARNRRLATKIISLAKDSVGENSASRVQQAQQLAPTDLLNDFHKLNNHAKTFVMMQLKGVRSNKMARRYQLQEKLLCLLMFKQSPKNYKLLEHMFSLPNKRTLNRLSEKIIFEPGINDNIFAVIKNVSKKWNTEKKLCSIVFDEVSINTQLHYNEQKDVIHGFCDIGGERKLKYCDHALVIMIRGVCSSWRQPLAYYFCEGTVAAADLKTILKEVVARVSECGLLPLAFICDQGSTFRTALKGLRQETVRQRNIDNIPDDGTIQISGHDLSIIFDPPHLLKGIRNNFLSKDMLFDSKVATWNDIISIYDIDSTLGHTRALPKISKHHVDKDSIRKMRVSIAAQVLSARVAAMLRYTDAVVKRKDGEPISQTMATTADAVEFFDKLFDSVNGRPGDSVRGKLRTAVKPNSDHIPFWYQAIKKVQDIKFIDKKGKTAHVPSIRGWITTIKSFIRVAKLLFGKYNIKFFYPRFLNQDPLENFFGRMRAQNYRNVIPDANAFIYTFKSLVLSNILSPLSKFTNCEEDEGEQLVTLELLFNNVDKNKEDNKENVPPMLSSSHGSSQIEYLQPVILEKIQVHCSAYTAGYISRKLNKKINCPACSKTIITKEISSIHKFIMYREYKTLKKSNLAYPTEKVLIRYRESSQMVHDFLNKYCYVKNISKNLTTILKNQDLEWMGCIVHKDQIQQLFCRMIIRTQVHNWVKIINKIFQGRIDKKYVDKMDVPQKEAYLKFIKIRCKSKKKKS